MRVLCCVVITHTHTHTHTHTLWRVTCVTCVTCRNAIVTQTYWQTSRCVVSCTRTMNINKRIRMMHTCIRTRVCKIKRAYTNATNDHVNINTQWNRWTRKCNVVCCTMCKRRRRAKNHCICAKRNERDVRCISITIRQWTRIVTTWTRNDVAKHCARANVVTQWWRQRERQTYAKRIHRVLQNAQIRHRVTHTHTQLNNATHVTHTCYQMHVCVCVCVCQFVMSSKHNNDWIDITTITICNEFAMNS